MPILDLQKRSRELGRIRTGDKGSKGQPQKLAKFRITAKSKTLLEKVAELYGGTVEEWTPSGGVQQWEVYTHVDRIPIMVPPQPVTQWYEAWTAGGCVHRCDGETDYITGEACDPENSPHHEGKYAAKPTTRLNVILSEVEGIGYFRLESHGWNAAVELPQAAEFLAYAGGYVEGWLALEERVTKKIKDGESVKNRFLVPIIEIGVTPAQLMAGEGRMQPPSIEGGPVQRQALPAGSSTAPDYLAQAQDASAFETVVAIRSKAEKAGHLTPELDAQLKIVADSLRAATAAAAPADPVPDSEGVYEAEVVDEAAAAEADQVWQQVLAATGQRGMTLTQTKEAFSQHSGGLDADTATAAELEGFLEALANEQVPA